MTKIVTPSRNQRLITQPNHQMKQQITMPSQLEPNGYVLHEAFSHHELVAFVQPYMKKQNRYMIFYKVAAFLPLIFFFGLIGYHMGRGTFQAAYLVSIFKGFGLLLLLLPVHELIHGAAYKYVGAPNVSYGVVWRQLVFYAQADKFVVGHQPFKLVALAPFVCINLVLLAVLPFCNMEWIITIIIAITMHNGMCAGDFALLSYFHENEDKHLLTYDDATEKRTYFYQRS